MANDTLENLEKAKIVELQRDGSSKDGLEVTCRFNPYEYTVSKSNSFSKKYKNDSDTPQVDFSMAGEQTLRLSLVFDTYETDKDVSEETRKLWKLMETKHLQYTNNIPKKWPPPVAFEWGVFRFVAYITSMTQRFTLFKHDGTPVRAKVDVTFTQYTDVEDYRAKPQNPTSGSRGSERVWRVAAGDRLDIIAAEVYHDAIKWRLIAAHNRIMNPLALHPGQLLRIPLD